MDTRSGVILALLCLQAPPARAQKNARLGLESAPNSAPVPVPSGSIPGALTPAESFSLFLPLPDAPADRLPESAQRTPTQASALSGGAGAVYGDDPRIPAQLRGADTAPVPVARRKSDPLAVSDHALTGKKGDRILKKLYVWAKELLPAYDHPVRMQGIFDQQGLEPRPLVEWLPSRLPEKPLQKPVAQSPESELVEAQAPVEPPSAEKMLRMMTYDINAEIRRYNERRGKKLPRMSLARVQILEDSAFSLAAGPEKEKRFPGLPDLRRVVAFHDQGLHDGQATVYVLAGFARLATLRQLAAAILHEHLAASGMSHDQVTSAVYEVTYNAFVGGVYRELGGAVHDKELRKLAKEAAAPVTEAKVHGDYIEGKISPRPDNHPLSVLLRNKLAIGIGAGLALYLLSLYLFSVSMFLPRVIGVLAAAMYLLLVSDLRKELFASLQDYARGEVFVPVHVAKWVVLPFDPAALRYRRVEGQPDGRQDAVFETPSGWELRMIISAPYPDGSHDLGYSQFRVGSEQADEERFFWVSAAGVNPRWTSPGIRWVRAAQLRRNFMRHVKRALEGQQGEDIRDFLERYEQILEAKENGLEASEDLGGYFAQAYRQPENGAPPIPRTAAVQARPGRIARTLGSLRGYAPYVMGFAAPPALAAGSFLTGEWPVLGLVALAFFGFELMFGGFIIVFLEFEPTRWPLVNTFLTHIGMLLGGAMALGGMATVAGVAIRMFL